MENNMAGQQARYSGTPLAKKLGIKAECSIALINAPGNYFDLFTDMPPDISIINDLTIKKRPNSLFH